jgi:iron complex transport system ATP-binding protein
MSDAGSPLLRLSRLNVAFGKRGILHDIALSVREGEFAVVVGPNGAGKTTLLRAAAGLLRARGDIIVGGEDVRRVSLAERARRVAYLPQGQVFYWPLAVRDVVGLGRLPRGGGASLSAADRKAVDAAMAATGVSDYAERSVTTLSGGERARVAIARVLATEAPVILADEPTAALDPRYQLIVLDILRKRAEAGGAVLAALHDLGLAARRATRVIVLDGGRIVGDGPPRQVLTKQRLATTFGVNAQIVELLDASVVIPWTVTERR